MNLLRIRGVIRLGQQDKGHGRRHRLARQVISVRLQVGGPGHQVGRVLYKGRRREFGGKRLCPGFVLKGLGACHG